MVFQPVSNRGPSRKARAFKVTHCGTCMRAIHETWCPSLLGTRGMWCSSYLASDRDLERGRAIVDDLCQRWIEAHLDRSLGGACSQLSGGVRSRLAALTTSTELQAANLQLQRSCKQAAYSADGVECVVLCVVVLGACLSAWARNAQSERLCVSACGMVHMGPRFVCSPAGQGGFAECNACDNAAAPTLNQ